jgi:CRP/FNR family cyclic AMP-dependent transcriptional regulator
MYHNLKVPGKCIDLWQECQTLVPDLLKDCPVKTSDVIVDDDNPLEPESGTVYLIKEGEIYETFDGQQIVIHEKGDLVNADALAHRKETAYETVFPATVDEYDGQEFIEQIKTSQEKFGTWNHYMSCLSQSYQLLMAYFSRQDTEYLPEYRQYKKDEVIIEEGSEGDEVFTLLNGTAKVVSNGEEVGEIHKDEIFGAIAALTNTKRNATIIATSDCDTFVTASENFRSILDTRPDIIQKLIQDMARTIVSSNERIIELSREKNSPDEQSRQ